MFFGKKKNNKKEDEKDKSLIYEYAKWTGQWNRREERKRELGEEKGEVKKVEGLKEDDIQNLSFDLVRIFLNMGYSLEKFPQESFGGQYKGQKIAEKYHSLDKLLIFINFFPKKAISDAINTLPSDLRGKIKKKLNIPPPMSQEEKNAVWNDFIQKYYFDEIERFKNEKERGKWFTNLMDRFKK